jgi:PPOX class probable F420-dependent enzyme
MSEFIDLNDELRALLDGPNYAHLATIRADGTPRNSVVWVGREHNAILICTSTDSLKARDMRRNIAVAISITAFDNPYHMAALQGRVIEARPDDGTYKDALARKYLSEPNPSKAASRTCFVIGAVSATTRSIPYRHNPPETSPQ